MGKHFTRGFTIIETMLVLAITGALVAGLLIGVGSSVSTQRYKDAVVTLKSFMQSQYSQVSDVTNTRDVNWSCGAAASPAQTNAGTAPGQSDCVILGRYVSIVGGNVTSAVVVGYPLSSASTGTDIATLKNNYTLGISTSSISTSMLEWGAQISWPQSGAESKNPTMPRSFAMVIVRSPDSGTMYTFTSNAVNGIDAVSSATLKDMMVENLSTVPGQAERFICVDPNGVGVPERLAIYVAQAANNLGAIEIRSALLIR
jgi:type II secretory pathway pseudopilin PulG